jgi:hypothetical protein
VEGLGTVFAGQWPLRVSRLIASRSRVLLTLLGGMLAVAPAAHADNRWALWGRPVDLKSAATGEWRHIETFDAQRWCKGAMTTAINQSVQAGRAGGPADAKAKITEYQCLPEGEHPPR